MRKDVTWQDLLAADSVAEFQYLWSRYEVDPVLLLIPLVIAIIVYFRVFAHSPLDRRSPERGTFYLGNTRLGRNPKTDGPGKLKTRLDHEPQYEPDDKLD